MPWVPKSHVLAHIFFDGKSGITLFTHTLCRTRGWKKLLLLMALSLALNNWSCMYLNHIDKHFSFAAKIVFFYHRLSDEASYFLSLIFSSPYFLPLKQSNISLWHLIWAANVVLFDQCWCKQKCGVQCLNSPAVFEDPCGQTPQQPLIWMIPMHLHITQWFYLFV